MSFKERIRQCAMGGRSREELIREIMSWRKLPREDVEREIDRLLKDGSLIGDSEWIEVAGHSRK